MPRNNQEQPDVPPFEYRAGVTMPPLGGMYRRGDPTQIPPHRLHLGVNIRLADNEAGSRPGLVHVEGTTEDACITGIFEIEDFAVGVYITQIAKALLDVGGTPDDTITPFQIMSFNEEKIPPEQNFWDEIATFEKSIPSPWRTSGEEEDAFNTFQTFNGTLLIANGKDVHQAEFSEDDQLPRLDLSQIFSLPDDGLIERRVTSTCVRRERVDDPQNGDEFEKDVLYMGVIAASDVGEVWRYDGTTIENVHTLVDGATMQVLCWRGVGLVAAGDDAGGFSYQEQPGFAWVDQAWGTSFDCHGLCEFDGQVVFVGSFEPGSTGEAKALRWPGSGAPVLFASETDPFLRNRYRTPVVAGGAVHWLKIQDESGTVTDTFIARFTDFSTGDDEWFDFGPISPSSHSLVSTGFFIPYAGAMLLLVHTAGAEGNQKIHLVTSGAVANLDLVYSWATINGELQLQPGAGFEAIPL